jgi:predicted phage replisome organizer
MIGTRGRDAMSEITWIKLKTDMFDNEKIKLIEALPEADTIIVIWVKLLAYAGRANAGGYIMLSENIPMTTEEMATIFNRPLNTVRLALETFKRYQMIEIADNETIHIKNWDLYQNIKGMERAKILHRQRQKNYRDRQKQIPKPPVPDDKKNSDVTVTPRDATDLDRELDIDKERDKEKEIKKETVEKSKIENDQDVEIFVDFALQNNLLPDQISKKIAIKYFDCIRLTRSSCKISENVLSNLVERMKKYTADQLNYAMWMHTDKHSEKKEQYTLGILRNTDVAEARRGLMKMQNITPKHKGVHYDAGAEQRIKEYSQYNIPF